LGTFARSLSGGQASTNVEPPGTAEQLRSNWEAVSKISRMADMPQHVGTADGENRPTTAESVSVDVTEFTPVTAQREMN
jgi:hypothetical protein